QQTQGGVIVFDGDAVELNADQKKTLHSAATALAGKPQRIEIRGHTAPRAVIDSKLGDHWDIAYFRCRAVMEGLAREGIELNRIRMGVAAHNDPLEAADGKTAGKRNSRVEIFMLNEFVDRAAVEKTVKPKPPED